MKFKSVSVLAIGLVVVGSAVFIYTNYMQKPQTASVENIHTISSTTTHQIPRPTQTAATHAASDTNAPAVENYIKKHINDFAAVQAELGQSYVVTKAEASNGKGVAYYQNDYNKYTADFTYSIDDFGSISIDRFVTRPVEE